MISQLIFCNVQKHEEPHQCNYNSWKQNHHIQINQAKKLIQKVQWKVKGLRSTIHFQKILWTRRFIEAQGHKINANIVFQDNTSAIKLEMNGKASSGEQTSHIDIKLFCFTDLIKRVKIQVKYCPTDKMIANYMTKPLVRSKCRKFRKQNMNI